MLPSLQALKVAPWTLAEMAGRGSWKIDAPEALAADALTLADWALTRTDPVAALTRDAVQLPAVKALAASVAQELDSGTGVAWVRGVPGMPEQALRLIYLAVGLELGSVVETYGRLYDVADSGESYRDKPIPVSQTRESTGMHTDSSSKAVCPRVIGLLCIRQAPRGGLSKLVSAAQVHEQLRAGSPALLERLYDSYVRDVVTPGAERDPARVLANRFPIFSCEGRLRLRYMRYWIERGHSRTGLSLSAEDLAAFDALDARLADPMNVLTFRMSAGEMLFIDNTTTAHDRDAYEDDLSAPRLLVRMWVGRAVPVS
jgi:hypothetical protein